MTKKKAGELFGVIGLGRFGLALTETLSSLGKELLVIDKSEEKVRVALQYTDNAFTIGTLTHDTLQEAGIKNCDTVIVCIGEALDSSILTTLNVLQMGVPRVLAKAISAEHGLVLEKLGAEVIYPEREMAVRVANRLSMPHMMEYFTLNGNVEITEIKLSKAIDGMTVRALRLRERFSLNMIAIINDAEIVADITPNLMLKESDIIVVVGKHADVQRFEEFLG